MSKRFYLECLYHLTTLISKFHIVTYSNLQLNKFCYIVLPASLSDIESPFHGSNQAFGSKSVSLAPEF